MKTLLYLLIFFVVMTGCKHEITGDPYAGNYTVKVTFKHKVGSSNFALNTNYSNPFGETYRLSAFKYYISNTELLRNSTKVGAEDKDGYHLVSATDAASETFSFNVSTTKLNALSFLIGVDSLRNVSGAQTGALDPLNGMFWTWSTGYIMAKMEGSSPVSSQPLNEVVFHIGGFKGNQNATRRVTLYFPPGKEVMTRQNGTAEITVECDINKWFNGVHPIKIVDFSATMSPGAQAMKYADNYATMHQVTEVTNQ
jgi:hypothetical protein